MYIATCVKHVCDAVHKHTHTRTIHTVEGNNKSLENWRYENPIFMLHDQKKHLFFYNIIWWKDILEICVLYSYEESAYCFFFFYYFTLSKEQYAYPFASNLCEVTQTKLLDIPFRCTIRMCQGMLSDWNQNKYVYTSYEVGVQEKKFYIFSIYECIIWYLVYYMCEKLNRWEKCLFKMLMDVFVCNGCFTHSKWWALKCGAESEFKTFSIIEIIRPNVYHIYNPIIFDAILAIFYYEYQIDAVENERFAKIIRNNIEIITAVKLGDGSASFGFRNSFDLPISIEIIKIVITFLLAMKPIEISHQSRHTT